VHISYQLQLRIQNVANSQQNDASKYFEIEQTTFSSCNYHNMQRICRVRVILHVTTGTTIATKTAFGNLQTPLNIDFVSFLLGPYFTLFLLLFDPFFLFVSC